MKKILITLLSVLVLAGALSAQANFTITGSFYTSIGMDLDNGTTGIKTGVYNLGFQALVGEVGSVEQVSDNDMYGEVMIKGLTVETETQYVDGSDWGSLDMKFTWDTIAARVVFSDNFSIGLWHTYEDYSSYSIYGAVGTNFTFVQNAYDYYIFDGTYGATNATAAVYNTWDMTNADPNNRVYFSPHSFFTDASTSNAKFTVDASIPQIVDINAVIGSWKAWSDTSRFSEDANGDELTAGDNAYVFSLRAALTAVENLTFKVVANFDLGKPWYSADGGAQPLSFAALASYKLSLGEDIAVTPQFAFDGQLPQYDSVDFTPTVEFHDGFDFGLVGGVMVDLKNTKIAANVGYSADNTASYEVSGVTVPASVDDNLSFTASVSFGLVDNLKIKGAFEYIDGQVSDNDVTDSNVDDDSYAIAAEASYDIKVSDTAIIAPYAKFSMDNKDDLVYDVKDFSKYLKAGVTLSGFVDYTTFKLYWESNDLADVETAYSGEVLGQLVFKTSIAIK